jgi:hypothetical protein
MTPARPDPRRLLAKAQRQLADARKTLAGMRQAERDLRTERGRLEREIQTENYQAGQVGRAPEGIPERRARIAEIEQESVDYVQRLRGAEETLGQAEEAVRTATIGCYRELRADLATEKDAILEEEERLAEAVQALQARRVAYRNEMRRITRTIPGYGDLTFVARDQLGVQGGDQEQTLDVWPDPLDRYGARALIGYVLAAGTPRWLLEAQAQAELDAQEEEAHAMVTGMAQTPATFASGGVFERLA